MLESMKFTKYSIVEQPYGFDLSKLVVELQTIGDGLFVMPFFKAYGKSHNTIKPNHVYVQVDKDANWAATMYLPLDTPQNEEAISNRMTSELNQTKSNRC